MTDVQFAPRFAVLRSAEDGAEVSSPTRPDRQDGAIYDLPSDLHLAVEVALSTGRPLLLRGDPGSGKSSLAPYVARKLVWRYYEHVVTSQTTATDLLYRFDAVRRLGDASRTEGAAAEREYLEPGVLWWAFDRSSAAQSGGPTLPRRTEPGEETNRDRDPWRAVVLIDEIDKAHPDVPNGLLSALGAHRIDVPYLREPVQLTLPENADGPRDIAPLLVLVTTNNERELPAAFVRRCLVWTLEHPDRERLVRIARRHVATPDDPFTAADEALAKSLADIVGSLRADARPGAKVPSTAEFLDAFRACRAAGARPPKDDEAEDPRWSVIRQLALEKPEETPW